MRADIGAIILGTSLVQLALGFFGTFISLRVKLEGFADLSAGLVLSAYFAGFAVGAVTSGRIIARIGSIRAYAAFAGCVVAAIALMPVWVTPFAWIVLRCAVGIGCAGLFVATESWLNAKATAVQRGRVFSLYMVGLYLALALGQLLIVGADIAATRPFNILSALFAIALVIVSTTHAEAPVAGNEARLAYGELARAAPLAVGGAAVSGFVGSCFYSLVPASLQDMGIAQAQIAFVMLGAVLGGLAFQIPIGRLSDRVDRRIAIALVAAGFAIAAVTVAGLPPSPAATLLLISILGGFMSTLYPISVAHAHDRMSADRVVSVSGRLILINGLGSILGPLVGTALVSHAGIESVFYLMAVAGTVLAVAAVADHLARPGVRRMKRRFEIMNPQAAPHADGDLPS